MKTSAVFAVVFSLASWAQAWHSWSPQEQDAMAKRLVDEIAQRGIGHAVHSLHSTPEGVAAIQEFIDRTPLLKEVEAEGQRVAKLEGEIQGNLRAAEALLRAQDRDGRVVFVNTDSGQTKKLRAETGHLKKELDAAQDRLDEVKHKALSAVSLGMGSLASSHEKAHSREQVQRKALLRAEAEKILGLK